MLVDLRLDVINIRRTFLHLLLQQVKQRLDMLDLLLELFALNFLGLNLVSVLMDLFGQ